MSKRKLLQLVNERRVSGWDDPRMPTLAGLRRRGVTPEALRDFAELIGVAKNNSVVDIGKFEFAVRTDLEATVAAGAMAVLTPLAVALIDWPAGRGSRSWTCPWWPLEPGRGAAQGAVRAASCWSSATTSRSDPPGGWKRLAPGREVRLAGAYVVRCEEVVRDEAGEVRACAARTTRPIASARSTGERRRGGTLHWVHATRSLSAEVRLYDRLFTVEQPDAERRLPVGAQPRRR